MQKAKKETNVEVYTDVGDLLCCQYDQRSWCLGI